MTPAELQKYLDEAVAGADIALPLMGHAELVPIVESAKLLIEKIAAAAQNASGDATVAAAMQAARTAADVIDKLKFPNG